MEFRRMLAVLRNVRQHSDNWALGRHRVLDIAVAPTVGPNAFTSFFLSALEQLPSVGIRIHALQSTEDTAEVLSGKYRSEERRVGKECVSQCRSRWSPFP